MMLMYGMVAMCVAAPISKGQQQQRMTGNNHKQAALTSLKVSESSLSLSLLRDPSQNSDQANVY